MTPGFSTPAGSSARFIAVIAAISSGERVRPSQRPLGDADAVLGADRAAVRGHELEHRLVDALVVRAAEHVDVQVAVAEMAPEDRARARRGASTAATTASANAASAAERDGHVELVRHARGVDRLVERLAVGHSAVAARRVVGHRHVATAPRPRAAAASASVGPPRRRTRRARRRRARRRTGARAAVRADQVEPGGEEDLGGRSDGSAAAQPGDDADGGAERGRARAAP